MNEPVRDASDEAPAKVGFRDASRQVFNAILTGADEEGLTAESCARLNAIFGGFVLATGLPGGAALVGRCRRVRSRHVMRLVMTWIIGSALLLGACVSSYPCISSNADPVFEVSHTGGWNPRWVVRSIALLNDGTIVVTSRDEQRCAKLSASEMADLRELVLSVSKGELGKPIVAEDARNLGLRVGTYRTYVAYRAAAEELTPEGAAFIRRLDVIAQEHFGRYYDHTLTRLEAPRHRFW